MGYSPKCVIKGHIGYINFLTSTDELPTIRLSSDSQGNNYIQLLVKDVRSTDSEFRHKLGICVQSIFSSADWVSYVQFFELWINQGVTKFIVYRQSNSIEVEKIFNLYKNSHAIEVEIIDWSQLPWLYYENKTVNPNLYSLRMLGLLSIFDCMHRSRKEIKFLAETDIDEVIFPFKNKKLVDYMEEVYDRNPNMASILFQSKRIRAKNNWYDATHPNQLDFNFLSVIEEENYLYKEHWTKMVHLPNRGILFHHHFGRKTETNRNGTVYRHLHANPQEAIVLHFRKYEGPQKWKGSTNSTLLENLAMELNNAYKTRVDEYKQDLSMSPDWQNTSNTVNKLGEKCALKPVYLHTCVSADPCVLNAMSINSTTWIIAKNTWLTL